MQSTIPAAAGDDGGVDASGAACGGGGGVASGGGASNDPELVQVSANAQFKTPPMRPRSGSANQNTMASSFTSFLDKTSGAMEESNASFIKFVDNFSKNDEMVRFTQIQENWFKYRKEVDSDISLQDYVKMQQELLRTTSLM